MKIMETISELPDTTKTVAAMTSIISLCGSLLWGAFFLDARYAHAADLDQQKQENAQQIVELRIENKKAREAVLQDKIFEIQIKPKQTDIDKAMLERAQAEARQIEQEVQVLQEKIKK